ncbi:MAG: type II toxin-antitoxin system VapC family toxin [Candidatus Firestonebacteria bacterium]|nr:type II toxin-antitoxin system VapC family toxin [Candidatus Firestonebacteria bacterium]
MKYLLDTNICIYIIKKKPLEIFNKLVTINISDVGISSITLSELEYGVEKSQYPDRNRLALLEFLSPIEIYNFDDFAAKEYGIIRTEFEKKGNLIGPLDMLIAAHAKSLRLILVTNNENEFKKVSGLKIENWTKFGYNAS